MADIEIRVPDIGDFKDVPVVTVLVKAGDTVGKDDGLVELESDKATMEVPSPCRTRAPGAGRPSRSCPPASRRR